MPDNDSEETLPSLREELRAAGANFGPRSAAGWYRRPAPAAAEPVEDTDATTDTAAKDLPQGDGDGGPRGDPTPSGWLDASPEAVAAEVKRIRALASAEHAVQRGLDK